MKKISMLAIIPITIAGWFAWSHLNKEDNNPPANPPTPTHSSVQRNRPTTRWAKIVDPSIRWQVRVDQLRRFSTQSLSTSEIDELFALLNHRPQPQHAEDWWVVVNEVMEQLRLRPLGRERLTQAYLEIVQNPEAHPVLRDYAVQHLSMWITPRGTELGNPHEEDLDRIQEAALALAETVTDPSLSHTTIPGTTLMAIHDMKSGGLSSTTIETITERLHPWLKSIIDGSQPAAPTTRGTTINVVGLLRIQAFAPTIRTLATSKTTSDTIRLNAISALGHLGDDSDRTFLEELTTSGSKFQYAAQTALRTLDHPTPN